MSEIAIEECVVHCPSCWEQLEPPFIKLEERTKPLVVVCPRCETEVATQFYRLQLGNPQHWVINRT